MLSLVPRSNQDGISKLSTASQLAETKIVDRNSKEHTQNKVNQKELSQMKQYFSFFTKTETKLWTKSTWKPKKKDCQGRSNLIYSQVKPSLKCCTFVLCII